MRIIGRLITLYVAMMLMAPIISVIGAQVPQAVLNFALLSLVISVPVLVVLAIAAAIREGVRWL